jgi:hypothetical protein
METVKYTLKSQPDVTIDVPKECHECADALVDLITQTPLRVNLDIGDHPCLGNVGILSKARDLLRTPYDDPKYTFLQDALYLRVCINRNEKKMRGSQRDEALEFDLIFSTYVQEIESSLRHQEQ